jgi:tetratricopeptide (TPR) repeat protein
LCFFGASAEGDTIAQERFMKTCSRCDNPVDLADKYCGSCGINLATQARNERPLSTLQSLKVSDIRFNLGVVYLKAGKFAQAIATFGEILEKDPENLQVRGMYEQALKTLNNTNSGTES